MKSQKIFLSKLSLIQERHSPIEASPLSNPSKNYSHPLWIRVGIEARVCILHFDSRIEVQATQIISRELREHDLST